MEGIRGEAESTAQIYAQVMKYSADLSALISRIALTTQIETLGWVMGLSNEVSGVQNQPPQPVKSERAIPPARRTSTVPATKNPISKQPSKRGRKQQKPPGSKYVH